MTTTLAERIEARMSALGKNPSSVALEAGMGRSSVRDIIAKGANPRIDTLKKLTGPLECSLEYLTGQSEDPGEQPAKARNFSLLSRQNLLSRQRAYDAPIVETAVFRPVGGLAPMRHISIDPLMLDQMDYSGYRYGWVVVGDASLANIYIAEGDMLTYARKAKEATPIRNGDHLFTSLNLNKSYLSEQAIRTVKIDTEGVILQSHGADQTVPKVQLDYTKDEVHHHGNGDEYRNIRLSDNLTQIDAWERQTAARGAFNTFATEGGHSITVHGIIVRAMRLFKPPV